MARKFMIIQKTTDDVSLLINDLKELKSEEFALIIHDKDKGINGEPVISHIHCFVRFKTALSLNNLAAKLRLSPINIIKWTGHVDNAYKYLLHLTENQNQYIYNPEDIVASFDFKKYIFKITNKNERRKFINEL